MLPNATSVVTIIPCTVFGCYFHFSFLSTSNFTLPVPCDYCIFIVVVVSGIIFGIISLFPHRDAVRFITVCSHSQLRNKAEAATTLLMSDRECIFTQSVCPSQ